MDKIITLHPLKNEARVDSRTLAEYLQNQHKAVIQLLDVHKARFERFGPLPFKMAKGKPLPQGGFSKSTRHALLNEDQAYLLLTFSRNTEHVADLKVELVTAFSRFRKHQQTEADYLPYYHDFHQEVKALADLAHRAGSTTSEQIFHINFNRLINSAFGLDQGLRQALPDHLRIKVTAAHVVAGELLKEAINSSMTHKEAYRHVKRGIEAFAGIGPKRLGVAR